VDYIRVDDLQNYIQDQVEEAEQKRIQGVEQKQSHIISQSTGKIEAFDDILQYISTISETDETDSLDVIRQ
jgi:hypothetical protein